MDGPILNLYLREIKNEHFSTVYLAAEIDNSESFKRYYALV